MRQALAELGDNKIKQNSSNSFSTREDHNSNSDFFIRYNTKANKWLSLKFLGVCQYQILKKQLL